MLPSLLLLLAGVATASPVSPFNTLIARQAATPDDLGIPPSCASSCDGFINIYNACHNGAVTDCLQVCEPNNWAGFKKCASCVLIAEGATQAQIDQALIPAEQACEEFAAGAPVDPSGALTSGTAGGIATSAAGPNGDVGTVSAAGPTASAGPFPGGASSSAKFGAVSSSAAGAPSSAHPSAHASASASASAPPKSAGTKLAPSAALAAVALIAVLLQ